MRRTKRRSSRNGCDPANSAPTTIDTYARGRILRRPLRIRAVPNLTTAARTIRGRSLPSHHQKKLCGLWSEEPLLRDVTTVSELAELLVGRVVQRLDAK